jgi:hypothetical protein
MWLYWFRQLHAITKIGLSYSIASHEWVRRFFSTLYPSIFIPLVASFTKWSNSNKAREGMEGNLRSRHQVEGRETKMKAGHIQKWHIVSGRPRRLKMICLRDIHWWLITGVGCLILLLKIIRFAILPFVHRYEYDQKMVTNDSYSLY